MAIPFGSRQLTVGLVAIALSLPISCVPPVDLDRAPCPCGAGYRCCQTLGLCLRAGASCPETYPPSSGATCARDEDCARGEACHSWTVSAGQEAAGPRECRRRCEPSIACTPGESCQLAPHDGRPLTEFATIPLCLSQIPQPSDGGPKDALGDGDGGAGECDKWTCQGCPVDKVGRTFCQGTDLFGCLVSTNPRCGLKCEKVLVKHCNKCVETEGVIDCEETGILPQDPCKDLPCSACPAGQVTFCQDRSVSTCLRAAFEGEACHEICLPEELAQCPQQCVQAADQAQCAP